MCVEVEFPLKASNQRLHFPVRLFQYPDAFVVLQVSGPVLSITKDIYLIDEDFPDKIIK